MKTISFCRQKNFKKFGRLGQLLVCVPKKNTKTCYKDVVNLLY